jgi:mannan endo-1,4-beta-mannosidase
MERSPLASRSVGRGTLVKRLLGLAVLALLLPGCGSGTVSSPEQGGAAWDDGDGGMSGSMQGRMRSDGGSVPPGARVDGGPSGPRTDAGTAPDRPPAMGERSSYYVEDGLLFDPCGEELVMRGVNHPTLYVDRAGKAMAEIARTGANAVRLFWYAGNGIRIAEAEASINAAVANGLLPMLEMHDSTCKWELEPIIAYWTSAEALALIAKHQKHLLVNIANEASPANAAEFKKGYSSAIMRMRTAGIHVPLVIDGGRCGRDYQMLLDNAAALLEGDPDHNLIFSAHLYDPLSSSQLGGAFDNFRKAKIPFIVGEFANKEPPGCGKPLDYAGLVSEAERAGIGWLAWSWGDDNASTQWNTDCGEFDMTSTFSTDTLLGWGREVAMTHPASIQKTAQRPFAMLNNDSCE